MITRLSEAQLIEIERRALELPDVAEYLNRRGENLECKSDAEENCAVSTELLRKARVAYRQSQAIARLAENIDVLIAAVRAGAGK